MNRHRKLFVISLLFCALVSRNLAMAHGDEDHGDESLGKPAQMALSAPRAAAQSDAFELVAVMANKNLLIYLDDFASNEPVAGAKVEVEGSGLNGIATESSAGIYSMAAEAIANAPAGSKVALTITIEAGKNSDLLSTTLEIPVTAAVELTHTSSWSIKMLYLLAAALGLAGAALFGIRRRQQQKGSQ